MPASKLSLLLPNACATACSSLESPSARAGCQPSETATTNAAINVKTCKYRRSLHFMICLLTKCGAVRPRDVLRFSSLPCLPSTNPISEQLRGGCSDRRCGHVEPSFFGNEEAGARAGGRADRAFQRVTIRILLPHDVDPPLSADDVEALALRVEENVVGVFPDRLLGHDLSRIDVVYEQHRGLACSDEQPPARLIERHWIIGIRPGNAPSRDNQAFLAIHHRDVVRRRHVDEDPRPARLQLEGFRMSGKPDIARRVTGRGIERAQRALSVSDVHLTRAGVVADVVGIIKPLDALDARERSPVQDIDAVGAAVRDIDAIELGQIENPLRLAESGDASFAATRPYVDDFQRVIAEGGDEKPLLLQVNPEVVDAPLHGRQAYGRSRLEHICRLRPGGQNKRQEWYQNQLALRFHFVAPFSAQCQSQSQPQLPDGLVSVVSPANTDIERKTVPEAPDCADEPRGGPRAAERLLAEHFGDRAHRPGMRAFEDGAQEKVGLVLARPRESRIEMNR